MRGQIAFQEMTRLTPADFQIEKRHLDTASALLSASAVFSLQRHFFYHESFSFGSTTCSDDTGTWHDSSVRWPLSATELPASSEALVHGLNRRGITRIIVTDHLTESPMPVFTWAHARPRR
jgi:hypothetical protein